MTTRRLIAAVALALAVVTAWLVHAVGLNHDVAWFLEVARQVRDGATLDGSGLHDPKEMNPPLAIWLFVPALWLGGLLGLPQSVIPALLVALEAAAALVVVWRLLRVLPPATREACVLATAFASVSLVGYDFAQREHQLVLLLTPALWSLALVAAGRPASPRLRVLAGVLAGLGVAFKPHFVVAWGAVEIATAIVVRRPRLVWRAETLAAAAVLLAYAAVVLIGVPGYLPLLRVAAQGYIGWLEQPWSSLLGQPEAVLALGVLAVTMVRRGAAVLDRAALTFAMAGVAFALVAISQRKGFSYHWYPPFAWSMLAALLGAGSVAASPAPGAARRLVPHAAVIGVLLAIGGIRLHGGIFRATLHRETARQLAVAAGGPTRSSHDLFIISVPVEGPFPVATYLGLRWPTGMPPGFMSIAMAPRTSSSRGAPTPGTRGHRDDDPDQALRDFVWDDLAAADPRVIVLSPMYTRSTSPRPIAGSTVADFFAVDPRFAELFSHYRRAGIVDRLGQPYYVVLRRTDVAPMGADRGTTTTPASRVSALRD